MWQKVIETIEDYVSTFGLPEMGIYKPANEVDYLPIDPANLEGKDLADKLFEYSGYVSYLDAELGRIDSQKSAVEAEYLTVVEEKALVGKTSKPKAKTILSLEDPDMKRMAKKLAELDALYRRVAGMREGYYVRLQACSREVSRRANERA